MIPRLSHALSAIAAMAVALPAHAGIVDGGFEVQNDSTSFCYFPTTCLGNTPWTGSGSGIIHEDNLDWPGIQTAGSYHAFVQRDGILRQTFVADQTGWFTLGWLEGGRTRPGYSGPHAYQVLIDGAVIYDGVSQPGGFVARESSAFALAAGTSYILAFLGTPTTSADTSTFIDEVALSGASPAAVPEPASWAMMIGGFGLVGGVLRRRRPVALA